MTKEQWNNLKNGDVIRFNRKDGTYTLRTIIARNRDAVVLPIMYRSWTGRIHTVKGFHDCHNAEPHGTNNERLMTELLRLCERGFDIPRQLHRERERFGSLREIATAKIQSAAMVARKFCTIRAINTRGGGKPKTEQESKAA